MTDLIQGCSVLKATPILQTIAGVCRYRLALNDLGYVVHMETKAHDGSSGEMLLYQGDDLNAANLMFEKYSGD